MTDEQKSKTKNRLHRLEGQLRGIENMVYANREVSDIVQQLWAVRASVTTTALALVEESASSAELLKRLLKSL